MGGTVDLPFRAGDHTLGDSKVNAIRRLLQMERKGDKYPKMYEGYKAFMRTYFDLGHMELVPDSEIDNTLLLATSRRF